MTLNHYGDEETIEIQAADVSEVMGDIKAVTFNLTRDNVGQDFYCVTDDGLHSPNTAPVKDFGGDNYFVTEWSEWTKCSDVGNKILVNRRRRLGNDKHAIQSRYCRCSDLEVLPSPRYIF